MKYQREDVQKVHDLRKEGYTLKDISELTDIPTGTVGSMLTSELYLDKWGIKITGRKNKTVKKEVKPVEKEVKREKNNSKAILILFCDGKSKSDIANILNLPIDVVNTTIDCAIEFGKLRLTIVD